MTTLNDSVAISANADIRKASVEQHRAKNRKVRYRNVNMRLIGQPISPVFHSEDQRCKRWNDRNKFKMPSPDTLGGACCRCPSCRHDRWEGNASKAVFKKVTYDDLYDYTADDPSDYDNVSRDGVDGIIYSYDRKSPSHGSQILTQALDIAIDKMETKQLERLLKDEYDVVYSEESASSEDDEYEFV